MPEPDESIFSRKLHSDDMEVFPIVEGSPARGVFPFPGIGNFGAYGIPQGEAENIRLFLPGFLAGKINLVVAGKKWVVVVPIGVEVGQKTGFGKSKRRISVAGQVEQIQVRDRSLSV